MIYFYQNKFNAAQHNAYNIALLLPSWKFGDRDVAKRMERKEGKDTETWDDLDNQAFFLFSLFLDAKFPIITHQFREQ